MGCVIALAVVSGCASTRAVQEPRTATTVPLSDALIFPPPGGPAFLSVVETNFANAVRQEIAFATNARTPGENHITVTRFLSDGGRGNDGELEDLPMTAHDWLAEAEAAWPGVAMSVSPYYVQNAYGPFGYAVGRSGSGDMCALAWQRVAPTLRPSGRVDRGAVTIRMQVCDRASTERAVLGLMYDMRLRDPVFEPFAVSPALGAGGAPLLPVAPDGFATVLDAPARPAPTAAPAPAQPVAAAPELPEPTGPAVPLPGGATAGTGTASTTTPSSTSIIPLPPTGGEN